MSARYINQKLKQTTKKNKKKKLKKQVKPTTTLFKHIA